MVDGANGRASAVETEPDETEPTQRHLVEFAGGGTGTGELTWAQRGLWRLIQRIGSYLPIGARMPLPPGFTVAEAIADLRFVMASYPTARTRLQFGGADPVQVVHPSGAVELEIVDAADDADPAALAKQVQLRFWHAEHDFVADWPVRMALIRHRGVLTHRIWVMCHLVTDGNGAVTILREMAARDCSRSAAARSALAQAVWQASAAGQRQSRASMRHWEKVLTALPASSAPRSEDPPSPRYWQALSNSPATYLAIRLIAARTGVEPTTVLLGLYALALARVTGLNPLPLQVTVSNRFRPGMADCVAPIMQDGLGTIDIADETVDSLIRRCRQRVMVAYKHAYYDPDHRTELLDRLANDRGEPVEVGFFFNDRRLTQRPDDSPLPTAQQVERAREQTSLRWTHKGDHHPFDPLYVYVDDEPGTIQLTLLNDTHWLAPERTEAVVRGLEEIAVTAALDPNTRTGLSSVGTAR